MADLTDRIAEELDQLRTVRDELRVKLHLGRAEIRDRWEQVEEQWQRAEGKLKQLREASREDAQNIGDAARQLAGEIRSGYQHLRSML